MLLNLFLFLVFLFVLIRSSDFAIVYSSRLAKFLHFPEFVVSFFIVALISVLPEATISIISALNGEPSLGLGTLLGSNVADLTIVFGIVALFSSSGIKVKSKIISNNFYYLTLLLFPLVLGLDGRFSRIDGGILILAGILFFVKIYFESRHFHKEFAARRESIFRGVLFLLLSLCVILGSAYLTVNYAVDFAYEIGFPAILIGITVLALGTCLPELVFSIKAVRKNKEGLALGDILGTVIADATVILGIIALISPFNFNRYDLYITGGAMFLAGICATLFMKSDKSLNKTEGAILIFFYVLFVFAEFFINKILGF